MKNNEFENNRLAELLYFYRLKKDLSLTEEKIQENQLIEIDESQNAIVKFWNKNVENFLRSDELKKYSANKESIEKKIEEFILDGKEFFLIGMAVGFDTLCFQILHHGEQKAGFTATANAGNDFNEITIIEAANFINIILSRINLFVHRHRSFLYSLVL